MKNYTITNSVINSVIPLNYGSLNENIEMLKESLKEGEFIKVLNYKEDGTYDLTKYDYGKYTICTFEFFNGKERYVCITNAKVFGKINCLLNAINKTYTNEMYDVFKNSLREGEEFPTKVRSILRITKYTYGKDGNKSVDTEEYHYNLFNSFYVSENFENPILVENEVDLMGEVEKQNQYIYHHHKVNFYEPYLFVRCRVDNEINYYRYIKYLQSESEYDDIKETLIEYVREDYLSKNESSEEEIENVDVSIELCRGEVVEMFGGMTFGLSINVLDTFNTKVYYN